MDLNLQQDLSGMAEAMGSILSEKDKDVDNFLLHMAEKLCKEFEEVGSGQATTVAEEKMQMLHDLTDERLSGISLTLEHKFGAMLKKYLTLCQERKASRALSRISVPSEDLKTIAENYRHCFAAYVDSPYVTYAATCEKELGKLSVKDAFVLHLWCMLNCYRAKGDKMFALSVSGVSSVGKSSLFESPAFENGHSYVAEAGVGRFAVKKRSTLIYSDISLDALYKSKDAAKFRTIARSEPTTCKVFADTCTLPPLWVLITSNQRIHSHSVPADRKNFLTPTVLPSQMVVPPNKRQLLEESLAAVRNRVIESFCRKRPEIDPSRLPTHGSFGRIHFVLGAYSYIISVLQKYSLDSFYSPMILKYVFTSLCDNMELYRRVMDDAPLQRRRLVCLLRRLVPCKEELLGYMKAVRGGRQETAGSSEEEEPIEENVQTEQVKEEELDPETNEATAKRGWNESLVDTEPPSKRNRFVDSDITDTDSDDDSSESSSSSDSSDGESGESDTDSNDDSDDAYDNTTTGTDDYTCNFETQRLEQDAQELI